MNTEYDLAILGGGINGVAIARDAAQRGLKTILFESRDFGSGASSKSSKLAHGGLRYLAHLSFGLVKESLRERARLKSNAPHLVKPLPFLYPVYSGDRYPHWMVKMGLSLYDWLSPKEEPTHLNLTPSHLTALLPHLTPKGLKGGCLYYDALMQDNRLVIENMLSAQQEGAIAHNYTEVTNIVKTAYGFQLTSHLGPIHARCLVNATGAWSKLTRSLLNLPEAIDVYPTKGVHLVLPQIHPSHALALTAPQDGRLFFLVPWMGYSLLGTTDTPFQGDPTQVTVEPADQQYLLSALRHYFPALKDDRIIASFAGLRPLISASASSPSSISREHRLHLSEGILTILGGKYTTYRQIAEEAVDEILRFLGKEALHCRTGAAPIYGAKDNFWESMSMKDLESIAVKHRLTFDQLKRLSNQYGSATDQILDRIRQDPSSNRQICPHHPHLVAELSYAIDVEKARCPEDWFQRRTSIAYSKCGGQSCLENVSKYFSK
ncbi:MAG: glycerol-3-phosphate dehydrogenase/oxidase [Parachlamydia sp.]|nr:glycerol-3-phosphate dehydrogenase/oxidase [Parachlamydia sp.]